MGCRHRWRFLLPADTRSSFFADHNLLQPFKRAEFRHRTPFQRLVVSIIITLDALLESDLLGTAAELRISLHLYP